MQEVYLVKCSNCEQWEDYNEWVESIWETRELAVAHIEKALGMEQVDWKKPELKYSRDRWSKENVEYLTREECESDEEWEEELEMSGGKPPIIWSDETDAWIVRMFVFSSEQEHIPWHEAKELQ